MGKYALLIGVDTYGEGLQPLPAASKDVAALREVLLNPQMGGFDEAKPLINPMHPEMAREIELWFQDRQPEDLVLLFFSGHGVKDDRRDLYFAAANTEKRRDRLLTSTAISAQFIHNCIRGCKAKYQVLILDCCFSGAFGDLVGKDDGEIPLREQLGAEGRVVLTSTSAVDYSFEEKGADLSIYTRYLVQGMATGAADEDENGVITVDELHRYARRKVKETSPAMSPDMIMLKGEGFRIRVARSPQDDPKLKYRKEAERRATAAEFTIPARRLLMDLRTELQISDAEAEAIEAEVLKPHRDYQHKRQKYQETLRQCLDQESPLSQRTISDLKDYQAHLRLKPEDVAAIEREALNGHDLEGYVPPAPLEPTPPTTDLASARSATASTMTVRLVGNVVNNNFSPPQIGGTDSQTTGDDLSSEKGIDYTHLRDLLKAQDWRAADQETYVRMLEAVGRKENDFIRYDELRNFPCVDLKTIDRLWLKYSNNHFGFSVQKKNWQECGSPTTTGDAWDRFCVKTGWKTKSTMAYVSYKKLRFDLEKSPEGELPGLWDRFYQEYRNDYYVELFLLCDDL